MITYVYEHDNSGDRVEVKQKITDDALTHCPVCGEPVHRVIMGGGEVIYKGEGWPRKDQRADKRVEDRLAAGDIPKPIRPEDTTMGGKYEPYYPGPGEGYLEG